MPPDLFFETPTGLATLLTVTISAALVTFIVARSRRISMDWVNLAWLAVLFATLGTYWLNAPSLLGDIINVIEKMISFSRVVPSAGVLNLAFLLSWLLAIRFVSLSALGAVEKNYPMAVGSSAHAVISLAFGYILTSWGRNSPTTSQALSSLLVLLGFYAVSKGVATGWFRDGKTAILKGDWGGVVSGIRILVLSLFFITEANLQQFRQLTLFLAARLAVALDPLGFMATLIAVIEICLLVLLLTELPKRLIFCGCKRCGMLFLKASVPVSSWDSEHTSRHRHCPRCSAACF